MQTIWQNPQSHGTSDPTGHTTKPIKKQNQKSTQPAMSQQTNQVTPQPVQPPRVSQSKPHSDNPTTASAQPKKRQPSGSSRLQHSTVDPIQGPWTPPASAPSSPWNAPQSSPFGPDPGFGMPPSGGFGGPSPWGSSPYGGFGGGPAGSGFGGGSGASNETPLSKMSEEQRQETIKKCFQLALGKDPEQKDFNYYKYSVLTESKLLHNLVTGTQHKELIEKGQKYNDVEKKVRELEMQVKFQEEHVKNTNEEVQLMRKVLQEKNSIIHVLRENINKFQNNPNRVEILNPAEHAEPVVEEAPVAPPLPEPQEAMPTPNAEQEPEKQASNGDFEQQYAETAPFEQPQQTPQVVIPPNTLSNTVSPEGEPNMTTAPISVPPPQSQPEAAKKTLFGGNPLRDLAKQLRNLLSPPY